VRPAVAVWSQRPGRISTEGLLRVRQRKCGQKGFPPKVLGELVQRNHLGVHLGVALTADLRDIVGGHGGQADQPVAVDHHPRTRFVGEHRLEMLGHNHAGIATELTRMRRYPVGAVEQLDPRGK